MKQWIFLFLFSLQFAMLNAQTEVPSQIISSIAKGDVPAISANLNDNVDFVLNDINDVYSKQMVTAYLNDFFRKNKVVSFEQLHSGNKESAAFTIGILKTDKGIYRIYVLTRKIATKQLIQQLRIEPSYD